MREVAGGDKGCLETENVLADRVAVVRCRSGRTCSGMWYVVTLREGETSRGW